MGRKHDIYITLMMCLTVILVLALQPIRWLRLLFSTSVRSLWAGSPIITLPIKAKAERLLGVDARTLVYNTYYITDDFDYDLSKWINKPKIAKFIPFLIILWGCVTLDRLHFFHNRGLLDYGKRRVHPTELALYKLCGIQLFFWTYGADVRMRLQTLQLGSPNLCEYCDAIGKYCICDDVIAKKNWDTIQRYATGVFACGDMIEYTQNSFNDLFFWPLDLGDTDRYKPNYPFANYHTTLKVFHAPNNRALKGTDFLIKAINQLQNEGLPIDLVLIEKVSNKEALMRYGEADLIFDQCLSGFHGYVTLEAMALGKPVMAYIRDPQKYLIDPDACPILNIHVNNIAEKLREITLHRENLAEIGLQGRAYVEKYFSVQAFALRLSRKYTELGVSEKKRVK